MKKRILAAFVSLCLLVSLMPGMTLPAAAAGSSQFDGILNMGQPSEFDPDSTENPYGYGVDQPFLMNEMSELGIYGIDNNGNYSSFLWYDGWDGEGDSIPNDFGKDGLNGSFDNYGYYENMRKMSFVEAVAFDPTGTGRKDHIAYIGFNTSANKIVLHVQDAETGTAYAKYEFPGNASWIKNSNPENWRAGNYFAITAGDYDGDGKETLVAFVTADNATDYGLYELSCNVSGSSLTVSQKSAGKNLLHRRYVNENHGNDMANTTNNFGNKLCCALTTGDFNGDGKDDLAAVSYLMAPPDSNKHFDCEYYLPMMAVSYGGNASSPVTDGGRQVVFVAEDNGISNGRRSYQTMTAIGLDAGDVDGDGTDEIVVGGTKNAVTSYANSADADTSYALDGETWNIAVFNARSDGSFASPGTDDSVTRFHSVASTGWFAGGTGGENSRSPLSLACVAFNGSIHEEYVFVGGKIIDFSTGGANALYTVSFVKDNDDSIESTVCDETFIPSVAVGNFDGNDYGYEQIFFVYANKQRYEDDYYYRLGVVGGKNYDGNGGGVGSAGGTDTSMFYERSGGFFIGNQGGAGAEGNWDYDTNFVLVSLDRDDDGVLARYKGKDWTYTDPQVSAVLQMAPYFDGIDLGSDSGETTYSFTQSYEYTKGTGNETSFGVGFAGEVETNFVTVELQAGSSNTWTETFEETLTTSTTDNFATKAYDSVVIQRTPVITYTYELYDKNKGGWSWNDLESTEDGTGFAISVPKTPAYVQMSVVDYNTFVDEYNALMKEKTGGAFTPMVKIDGQKSYLGQEGNPWGYASNLDQISSSNYQLGYNGGETQSTKSDGSATTESIESQHGFSFELSVKAGFEIGDNGAKAGVYASLEYMHSSSTSTTTASETETSGAVQNLDWQYLLEEYGIPESVTKSFGFTWNLAKDTINLGVAGSNALIIAYNVSNISAPAPAVNDLAAELQGLDSVHLTWSDPSVPGRLAVLGYYVYVRGEDDAAFRKVNEEPLGSNTLEYIVTGLDSNTEYTFVVTTDSENGESVWSNEAVITTPKAYVPLTMDYNENEVSVRAVHLGNVEIHSGDKVEEETIVYVDVAPKPGYAITEVTLTTEEGTETVTPVDGQFNFAIQEATTITVTAAVVAEESIVTYTADDANGTVSATVNGEAFPSTGATFGSDDEIIFTAAPADGYALKEWKVTDGSGTDKTYAAAGNTFTFHAYAAEHHVSAVFVPMAEVAKTVTLNVTAGGSIIVKDGDTVLTPDENGKISVPKGTTLTFEAEADRYYTFENWTDAFADYKNDVTSISLKIDNDVTVGAVFESFLAYTLTYGTQSVDGGSGTLTAEANGIAVQSGTTLTPGTTVDFDAAAGNDSRIQKWAVTENGITSFQELDSLGIVTEDAYQLILRANSNVEAAFKTIEKYDLTGSAFGGNGTITVQRGSGTVNSGTDVLRYYDDLTITLVPDKGYVITQYPDLDGTDTYSYTVSDVTADVDVNYTWTALNQYSVTYSVVDTVGDGSGTHGTISAAAERKGMELYDDSKPSVVYEDGTITFTAKPDEGYRVKEWIVNGVVQPETGNTLTLTPMQDLNVTVQYTSGLPKVSFADPAHGTLTAKMGEYSIESGAAVSGPVTFTVVPDEHYEVKCWTVNGVEQPGETGNTFTYAATDDCTVAVELWGVEQQVTLRTGTGGTASATDPARYGETITITATPDDGYVVDTISVSGTDDVLYENTGKVNGVQTAQYAITADTTFEITFAKKPVVTFSADNGSLTASGTADGAAAELKSGDYVDFGSAVTFTAVADSGYSLEGWYVDGAKIEHTDLTYTTDALSDNVNVEARFAAIAGIPVNYGVNDDAMGTITATADGRGFQSGDQLSGGQEIVFTVSPAEGYRVKDWTGLPADAQISADKTTVTVPVLTAGTWNVTANLEAIPQYTVTIEETTHGSITAAVDGQPLNSGDTVPDGTQVTFTATADDYWMLKEWTGDASGSDKTITLTVGSNITVGAAFTEALLYEVEYSVVGGNGLPLLPIPRCSLPAAARSSSPLPRILATW
ncbi:InlB B-repeat-containing protein [Flavonifractor sp. An112]|uniref:InlB B-repeat-containing protein n=1 Tax=Flavonifractor sp. An112 TaxID=1965544 RepID=UPI00174ABC1C|nr:fibronectin type III domain-containing protein [Flavonifractor sp. An112]